MKIKKWRFPFLISDGLFSLLLIAFHSYFTFSNWDTIKNIFQHYFLGIAIILAVATISYGLYELICKTYYVFTDDCVQIIKRKKILNKIPYTKIIEFDYDPIIGFDPALFAIPHCRLHVKYFNESKQHAWVELFCPLYRLKKFKKFPLEKMKTELG